MAAKDFFFGGEATDAQSDYEGPKDLSNSAAGDGREYCGRGLIQMTGQASYAA
jgi:putative chitinase